MHCENLVRFGQGEEVTTNRRRGREFWIVDPKRRTVKVTTRLSVTIKYSEGDQIPLPILGNATLSVAEIFATPK